MTLFNRRWLWTLLGLLLAVHTGAQTPKLKYRWVYCSYNMQIDANVPLLQALMKRAKTAGYTGIALADFKLNVLDRVTSKYFTNMAAIKQTAASLKLDLIPSLFPVGYAEGILAHDPNLAEGLPVRNAIYKVHNLQAELVPSVADLNNGGFEQAQGNTMTGWD